jgi:hypothetical protein
MEFAYTKGKIRRRRKKNKTPNNNQTHSIQPAYRFIIEVVILDSYA